jgi:hypothetical protein
MVRTGIFKVINGESLLNDGTLLAVCSDPSPLVAARPFLLGRQCQEGQLVQVSGDFKQLGEVTVFCMSGAGPATSEMVQDVAARVARPPKGRIAEKKKTKKQIRKPRKISRSKSLRSKKKPTKATRRKPSK